MLSAAIGKSLKESAELHDGLERLLADAGGLTENLEDGLSGFTFAADGDGSFFGKSGKRQLDLEPLSPHKRSLVLPLRASVWQTSCGRGLSIGGPAFFGCAAERFEIFALKILLLRQLQWTYFLAVCMRMPWDGFAFFVGTLFTVLFTALLTAFASEHVATALSWENSNGEKLSSFVSTISILASGESQGNRIMISAFLAAFTDLDLPSERGANVLSFSDSIDSSASFSLSSSNLSTQKLLFTNEKRASELGFIWRGNSGSVERPVKLFRMKCETAVHCGARCSCLTQNLPLSMETEHFQKNYTCK
jgi:hypothetical protein